MAVNNYKSVLGELSVWTEGRAVWWLTIPTGGEASRAYMKSIVLSEEERLICNMPSRDVHMRITHGHSERDLNYLMPVTK